MPCKYEIFYHMQITCTRENIHEATPKTWQDCPPVCKHARKRV